jgi:hypothetical protein
MLFRILLEVIGVKSLRTIPARRRLRGILFIFFVPRSPGVASHAVQNTLVAQQRGHDIPNQLLIAGFRDNSELRSGGLNIDKGTAGAD